MNRLPANLSMGAVTLKVADVEKMLRFYTQGVGLKVLSSSPNGYALGESVPVLFLEHAPELRQAGEHEAGLFHTAFLFTSESALAYAVAAVASNYPGSFTGSADHLVSKAFYFDDPEGNGVELYFDRPRDQWQWQNGEVKMATLALDPNQFLSTHLEDASPEVATVVEFAIERLELAGITFVDVEVPGTHDIALAGLHIVAFEAPREVLRLFGFEPTTYPFTSDELRLLRLFVDDIASQDVKSIFGHFVESPVDEATYLRALDKREKLQSEYDKVFAQENLDALIYPTVGIVAPEVGHDTIVVNGQERPHFPYSISNTDPGSLAGLPSISIPISRLAGALPVGLGVECSRGNDRHLLAVSTVIEEILTSS